MAADRSNATFGSGGHQLYTVRAGQQVALECGAAAQPQPRIRWFRLAPSGGGSGSGPGRGRQQALSSPTDYRVEPQAGDRWRLDESQLRSALIQMDLVAQSSSAARSGISSAASSALVATSNDLAPLHRVDVITGRGECAIHINSCS